MRLLGRRRVLGMVAAPAALAWPAPAGRVPRVRWQGSALGAEATLVLEQVDAMRARRIVAHVLAEVDRLEHVFSLHRADSALSRLNRDGRLRAPPHELVDLLGEAQRIHRLSAGAFDPSVQPLWRLHAGHFSSPGASAEGPSPAALERTRARVGFERVVVEPAEIRFTMPGMALTLNGIAQGAITDRVADVLRNEGLDHGLIDMGEVRAIGTRASGQPWSVALERRPAPAQRLSLHAGALATSDPEGMFFHGADARRHHLLDPRTGRSSSHARRVTVAAPRALVADALSTTVALMPPDDAEAIVLVAGPDVSIVAAAA